MYTLLRSLPRMRLVTEQVPAMGISLLVAELFYKFHSFVLECVAFLLTWLVVDAAIQVARRVLVPMTGHRPREM